MAVPAGASPFRLHIRGKQAGGGGGGSSPDVLPGVASVPTINNIAATNFGSPGDVGYNVRGWGRYTTPQLIEVGSSGVNGTAQIGAVFAHEPTNAELFSGVASNICSVDVRVDGGAFYTITGESVNASAGGIHDWNFTVNSQNYPDGVHQADEVGKSCTGPNIIMQGPLEDAGHYAPAKIGAATISNGSGSAGDILTVTGNVLNINNSSGSAVLIPGYSITGMGVGPNTFIDGTSTVNATSCVAQTGSNCTGAGNLGTYHLRSPATQLVASTVLMAGNARSFFFVTDFHNTLGRGVHVLYASKTGNDAWDGTSPTFVSGTIGPKLNPTSAAARITANSGNSGAYGGTVCMVDGGAWTSDAGVGTQPSALFGWLRFQGADQAPCVHPGDTGNPTLSFNITDRTWGGLRTWYRYMKFDGAPNTFNVGVADQLVAEHINMTENIYTGGLLGNGGVACLESSVTFSNDAGCNAPLVRNYTGTYYVADGLHGTEVALGNVTVGGGPVMFWATGTATAGQKDITNVSVPAGYTLSQIFSVGGVFTGNCWADSIGCIGVADPSNGYGSCFPTSDPAPPTSTSETVITAVNDAAHTITTNRTATCSVTNGPLIFPGVHGDGVQFQTGIIFADVYFRSNIFGVTFPGRQQGLFNQSVISGFYIGKSSFVNLNTTEKVLAVDGGNEKVIFEANTFDGNNPVLDGFSNSNDETLVGDKCPQGNTFTGNGTNIRRHAAASQACYTSVP